MFWVSNSSYCDLQITTSIANGQKGPKMFQKRTKNNKCVEPSSEFVKLLGKGRCKKIHYLRSRSYLNGALDMATFCQIFSMQSISSLVARCYVLERTPSNLQGTKANMQWSDHTFPAISLQYTPWTPFPPSFGQMLCGGSGWVLERTRTNLERTKAKATRATAPFIPALNLRICKIIS